MIRPGSLDPGNGGQVDTSRHKWGAVAGAIALLPALLLVATGFAGVAPPDQLDSPLLILGGLTIAIVLGLVTATRWEIRQQSGAIRFSCTVHKRLGNLLVLGAGLALLAIITVYLFLENFEPR